MSTPAEAAGREPNLDWVPGEWRDIRPHGTEARAHAYRRVRGAVLGTEAGL